jgi:hypothetical protein
VTAPLSREHDDEAVGQIEGDNDTDDTQEPEDPELLMTEVLSAIEKVCFEESSKTHNFTYSFSSEKLFELYDRARSGVRHGSQKSLSRFAE